MTLSEKESTPDEKSEELRTIFNDEEIRSTVKAFTLAFFRGTIKIQFNDAQTIIAFEKKKGKEISYTDAVKEEVEQKFGVIKDLEIISGSTESTNAKLDSTINNIFNLILGLRAGDRIKGTFLEFDIEKRMDQMDERISATNKIVEEFVTWYIETEKGNDKGPSN